MKIYLIKNPHYFIIIALFFFNAHLISFWESGGTLYAQNSTLIDNSWFVHAARDSNASNAIWEDVLNTEPELRFEITFMNDQILVQGCCGGSFEMDVNYNGNNELVIVNVTEIEIISCNDNYVSTFYQRIKGAFEGMIGETISYTIQQYNNGFGMALNSFILSHPSNNSFIDISNIPNEMNIDQSHAPFSGNNPPNHNWSPTHVEYDGETLELPYGAAITTFNIYEGTFEIVLCGSINGLMNFSWTEDVEEFIGPWFISCGELTNTIQNCEVVAGVDAAYLENFKQKTFNFLNESLNQDAVWEFNFGDIILTDSYKLTLTDLSQNKLIFHSNENYLNTTDFDLGLGIEIFPNPVTETLFIKNKEIAGEMTALVYSLNGKLLHTQNLESALNEIDVKQLNDGVYFIVFTNETGLKQTLKFIKK